MCIPMYTFFTEEVGNLRGNYIGFAAMRGRGENDKSFEIAYLKFSKSN